MQNLRNLLRAGGFLPREGATSTAIAEAESAFGVVFPDELRELWSYSDGMDGEGIDIEPLDGAIQYAQVFQGGFGYVPFTDSNDSNPYVVCCREPLLGVVAHIFHDEEARLVCRGLYRFLELVSETRRDGADVNRIDGDLDFNRPDRTAVDHTAALALIREAQGMDQADYWRGETLRFAAQLLGPGQEDELANVLAIGDEYTREAVLWRWTGLNTDEAKRFLREDAAAYQKFIKDLITAFDSAGLRMEAVNHGDYCIRPGNIGLNLPAIFADCRRPGAMDECVQRFKKRIDTKGM